MAPRRSNDDELRLLRVRTTELESRVRWLERRLKKLTTAAKIPPPEEKGSNRLRCPGCLAEVPKGRRTRLCRYCGFDFGVVKPFRRPLQG